MRLPLRTQIFVPFGALSVVAVVASTVALALLAARARERETLNRLEGVVETLRTAQFPFTPTVLEQMQGLTGAEFVVRDRNGQVALTTLETPPPLRDVESVSSDAMSGQLISVPSIRIGTDDYFAAEVPLSAVPNAGTLQVLFPVRAWQQLRWEAAVPPLVAGALASLAVLVVAGWLAGRVTHRLDAIRREVARIADGTADRLPTDGPDDELRDLASAVNSVSDQLRQHERTVRQTERMRLVAQLSSGLAHQLRNTASGARLAIQLVRRRHPDVANRELDVAMTQLELIEDHLRRLLTVGQDVHRPRRTGTVADLMRSVEDLASPVLRHSGVAVHFEVKGTASAEVPDFDGIRSGLLNLVMNGAEAAGRGGSVAVAAEQDGGTVKVTVADSGGGPDPTVADRIFEPFVTTKPEGVGLGLAFVQRMVESVGGSVTWRHDSDATRFVIAVPATNTVA